MIQINKELNRPDGGTVAAGSLLDYQTRMIGEKKQVVFYLSLFVSQAAKDEGKDTIPAVNEFKYVQSKDCTEQEWTDLTEGSGSSGALVQDWLKEIIDELIGAGNTQLV